MFFSINLLFSNNIIASVNNYDSHNILLCVVALAFSTATLSNAEESASSKRKGPFYNPLCGNFSFYATRNPMDTDARVQGSLR